MDVWLTGGHLAVSVAQGEKSFRFSETSSGQGRCTTLVRGD